MLHAGGVQISVSSTSGSGSGALGAGVDTAAFAGTRTLALVTRTIWVAVSRFKLYLTEEMTELPSGPEATVSLTPSIPITSPGFTASGPLRRMGSVILTFRA